MSIKKRYFFSILGGIVLLLFIGTFTLPEIAGGKSGDKPTWKWTKLRPKPVWWKWDYKVKPKRGGYIRYASLRYIGLMNPNHWPVYDWVAITQMYEDIAYVESDWKPTLLWLAESYKYTNPKTVIMKLRKGINFHDGTRFNAESVKHLMDYIKDKRNGCWSRAWIEPVKSVQAVDEYTVRWNFKRPWAGFMGMMATVPGYMISKKALEGDVALIQVKKLTMKIKAAKKKVAKLERRGKTARAEKERKKLVKLEKQFAEVSVKAKGAKPVDNNPVGTGRYMFEEGRPGNYLKLKRNPDWWFGKSINQPDMPYPDGMIIKVIPDPTVQLANLRSGKLHSMWISSPSMIKMLRKDRSLKVTGQDGNHLFALRFNTQKGPCKSLLVRKAISHAIDREALVRGIQFGQGKVASCMYQEDHWCHNPNLKPVKYDPELSKKLLARAGYSGGLTISGYMGNLAENITLSEAVQAMLKKVGITWKVDALDNVAISDRMKNAEFDLAAGGWAYIKDPDMMATGLYHPDGGFNYDRSHNKKAIPLIMAGNREINERKRQKIYHKLEKVLYDNYEDAWLWYPIINTARRRNLLGYNVKLHDLGREGYWFSHPEYLKDGKP